MVDDRAPALARRLTAHARVLRRGRIKAAEAAQAKGAPAGDEAWRSPARERLTRLKKESALGVGASH
jgi:hypothetical protein